jgi:hypothetical protein
MKMTSLELQGISFDVCFTRPQPEEPIPVAARCKVWFCGRTLAGIVGSNSAWGHGCLSLVSDVYCQVEVSATGRSLVQRSPTECGVSGCDCEASLVRRPRLTGSYCSTDKKNLNETISNNAL